MGLDFSHGKARWSYSGFMRFRQKLAKAEGLNLDDMEGYADNRFGRLLRADESPAPDHAVSWDTTDTPLRPLLDHSDCDGELTPAECAQVAPRLKEIVSDWPIGDYDRNAALSLVAAMEYCAEHGENLEFC